MRVKPTSLSQEKADLPRADVVISGKPQKTVIRFWCPCGLRHDIEVDFVPWAFGLHIHQRKGKQAERDDKC